MKRTHGARLAARRAADATVTFALYGVAERDRNELVSMFFANVEDRATFAADLPGTYRYATLHGVDYEALRFACEG